MARKNLNQVNEEQKQTRLAELNNLIPLYGVNKEAYDKYDKLCKSENAEIKAIMAECNMDSITVEGYKVTYSVSDRKSMNEDKLLELIQQNENLAYKVIKTKQYVDMDELEKAIYSGDIDEDTLAEMQKCEEVKKVETLRITKKKEKES